MAGGGCNHRQSAVFRRKDAPTDTRRYYVDRLFVAYRGRVPAEADLVVYWFEKAWEHVLSDHHSRAGLVATQAIRRGQNLAVLDRIQTRHGIFDAWDDEPWVLDGAAVRVSLICFGSGSRTGEKSQDRGVAYRRTSTPPGSACRGWNPRHCGHPRRHDGCRTSTYRRTTPDQAPSVLRRRPSSILT